MNDPDAELVRTFLSILQRGITEAETMVREGEQEMAADLLDALDNIPVNVLRPTTESEDQIDGQLTTFDDKYPQHYTRYSYLLRSRFCILKE